MDEVNEAVEGIEGRYVGHGLAFGKFMPPTNGHLFFLNFARQSCRKLTIVVCSTENEPIPGSVRYEWMKQLFPDCNVVHHYFELPQAPPHPEQPDHPDNQAFYNTWRDSLIKVCPGENFDALFASESYGYHMAKSMGAKFIPVDLNRDLVPISGTSMREEPLAHWEHLHPVIRPYFVKRVAVVGPEASGKTALASALAQRFKTLCVGDYAQPMFSSFAASVPGYTKTDPSKKDFSTIARGQMASEEALAQQANRLLFTDTDLLCTLRKAKQDLGACPSWISHAAEQRAGQYSLYLLQDPRGADAILSQSPHQPIPDLAERVRVFDELKQMLSDRKLPFAVISGATLEGRLEMAENALYARLPELATVFPRSPLPQRPSGHAFRL